MVLPNPIYIDANALHTPSVIRLLAYGLTSGVQGVIGEFDCAIKALGTPGAAVQAMPGAYMVRATHLGGSYEGYGGKYDVAETSATISATTSSGGRSDLVVLEIHNPYVEGSGSWSVPADPVYGPYAFIKVIEGVPNTTWDISQYDATREAITLARIDRPASTGVVQQSHITDLRSLAKLGGTRTVIEQTTLPPIAQSTFMEFKASASDPNYGKPTGGTDTVHDALVADTNVKSWPAAATWSVPVPDWAVECDAEFQVFNVMLLVGDVYGKLWLDFGGTATTVQTYAVAWTGTAGRYTVPYGITFSVPAALRGHVITVRTKFQSYYTSAGQLDAKSGVTTKLSLNFQRQPDPS